MILHSTGCNSYHHSDSLLFQFVLYEFLKTLEEVAIIQKFALEKVKPEVYYHQMTEYLVKLAGSEQEYMRIFSWISDSGVLTKLKNYTNLLSEHAKKSDPDFINLHNVAYKAWVDCIHIVELIHEKMDAKKELKGIREAVRKALASIEKLTPVIKEIIPKYKDDENVLFFLLRYKETFDRTLDDTWIQSLFTKFHPQGALSFMISRYKERGFTELLPEITERLKEIS